ncbi:MAG: hypothetical protein IJX87_00925 [Clostridia bacterium]|nr:hypothetical protein [Clostridia bacterium]
MKTVSKIFAAVLAVTTLGISAACGESNSAMGSSSSQPSSETTSQGTTTSENGAESGKKLSDWIVACDGAEVSLCTDPAYVRAGAESSVKYAHSENTNDQRMGAGMKFKAIAAQDIEENVTVYVYNATEYEYQLEAFCHQDDIAEIFQDYQEVAEYTLPAGEWTEVVVTASAIAQKCNNGTFDYFGFALRQADNGGVISQKWKSVQLYFDGLEIFNAEE